MLRGVCCPEAHRTCARCKCLYQGVSETLRSLETAPSHRPDVLREGDMVFGFSYPLLTLNGCRSALSSALLQEV